MRLLDLRKDRLYRLLYSLGLAANCILAGPAFSADKTFEINFQEKSFELPQAEEQDLKNIVEQLNASPTSVALIHDKTQGLKKSSLPFIIERTRALKIFQYLVGEGVDVARIELKSISIKKANADSIALEIASGNDAKAPKIVHANTSESAAGDFTLNFASASAIPENLDEAALKNFLGSVGQPDRDAIVIEGYTDSVGNAIYNEALAELRALSVFELMVREGLPPNRVFTKSGSKESKPGKRKDSAADRKVVLLWTKNASIAKEPAKVEEGVLPVAAPTPLPAPVKEEAAVVPSKVEEPKSLPSEPSPKSSLDLLAFGGILVPEGELKDHAKSGGTFGLGISKAFLESDTGETRATIKVSGKSTLKAKESSLSGPLHIMSYGARLDRVFGKGTFRPFVGVGIAAYRWDGSIVQKASELRHQKDVTDFGGEIALGLDARLSERFALSPEISWHKVGGAFSDSLLSVNVALRYSL